jgi:hypothetical protein
VDPLLTAQTCKINAIDDKGDSAVWDACWSGKVQVVCMLSAARQLNDAAEVERLINAVLRWNEKGRVQYDDVLQHLLDLHQRLVHQRLHCLRLRLLLLLQPLPCLLRLGFRRKQLLRQTSAASATRATPASAAAVAIITRAKAA